MKSDFSAVLKFIKSSLYSQKRFFLSLTLAVFLLFTFSDFYLYISLGQPMISAILVAFSRFFLYVPISFIIATYFTILRISTRISGKKRVAGVMGGFFAGLFTIAGCPACLIGFLAILSSLGLLGGGIFFWFVRLNYYAGILFVMTIMAMLTGIYFLARSSCRIGK